MHSGTVEDVRLKTLECILEAYDSPKGYIVIVRVQPADRYAS